MKENDVKKKIIIIITATFFHPVVPHSISFLCLTNLNFSVSQKKFVRLTELKKFMKT